MACSINLELYFKPRWGLRRLFSFLNRVDEHVLTFTQVIIIIIIRYNLTTKLLIVGGRRTVDYNRTVSIDELNDEIMDGENQIVEIQILLYQINCSSLRL